MELLVFIVDDDVDYSELLAFHLSSTPGVRVMTFVSGEAVFNQLEKKPDLVLLDVMMPGIDGLETLRRVKTRYPKLPVVMVSVQSTLEVALSAVKLGAADYLLKGQDDFVKLGLIVRQIFERKQLRHEIARLRDEVSFRSTNPRVCLAEAIRPEDLPSLDELKEMALLHAYEVCGGNIEKTARCLGVTRSTVYRLMKKFGVDEERTASASL